jgi:hypothetical protein
MSSKKGSRMKVAVLTITHPDTNPEVYVCKHQTAAKALLLRLAQEYWQEEGQERCEYPRKYSDLCDFWDAYPNFGAEITMQPIVTKVKPRP